LRPERILCLLLAPLAAHAAPPAFDANGVRLGDAERLVKQRFPSAHCQPLQWESRAADRRCDDSRSIIAGHEARITVYLKKDAVEALDIRFESGEAPGFAKLVTERFGGPPVKKDNEKTHTLAWRKNSERALLTTMDGQRRATLLVWRGSFYEEIYKVR
jgi:hypothetical protein